MSITPRNASRKKTPAEYFSLDLIPDPIVILKNDGTIHDVNRGYAMLVDSEKESLIGKHFRDSAPLMILGEKVSESLKGVTEEFELLVYNDRHFEAFIRHIEAPDGQDLIGVIMKDISSSVVLEKELLKRNKELIITNTLSSAFISSENMDQVLENILKKVLLITDFGIGWFLLSENRTFRMKTSRGISQEFKEQIDRGAMESLCGKAIKSGENVYVLDRQDLIKNDFLRKEGILFLVGIPLLYDKKNIGFLFLASRSEKERIFDFDLAALLSLVGNHVSLIIDKIRLFQETKRLSITDGLTGLYNSRYFYKQLDFEIAMTKRYGNSFSLALLDIDDFKQLNDTYGHQAGDEVLSELAAILKSVSRETDIVVRYGGEEFIIILPNTSEQDTINLAERIRKSVEDNAFLLSHSRGIHITLSGGVASHPKNAADAKSLLYAADTALYSAKAAGKNRIVCFRGKIDGKDIR